MKQLQVEVTQDDIDLGERMRCRYCPVALALKRATGFEDVVVGETNIVLQSEEYIPIPEDIGDAVAKYDLGGGMNPFSFKLEVPD